jgi:hypothetical protein
MKPLTIDHIHNFEDAALVYREAVEQDAAILP